jgi:hypothetical protein
MTYTRPAGGDPGNDASATDATVIIGALSDGLEAVETLIGTARIPATANGVVQDGKHITCTLSGTTITATGSAAHTAPYFTSGYINKPIWIDTGSTVHKTTITNVSSGTVATIASAPGGAGPYSAVFGTDNTAQIDTLLGSMSKGQALTFPAGDLFVLSEGGHVMSVAGTIVEGTHPSFSRIVVPSTTSTLFRNAASRGKIRQLGFYNLGAYAWFSGLTAAFPTAGAAIRQDDLGTNAHIKAEYDDLEICGFWNNAYTVSGWGAHFRRVWTYASVSHGILLDSADTDLGDWHVIDCRTYSDNAQYAGQGHSQVKWLSGGDVEIRGTNFQNGSVAIEMAQQITANNPSGKTYSTNFRIEDNSFEDPTTACVLFSPAASMTAQSWVISGNTMNSIPSRGGLAISASLPSGSQLSNMTVVGNSSSIVSPILTATGTGTLLNVRILGNGHGGGSATNIAGTVTQTNVTPTY